MHVAQAVLYLVGVALIGLSGLKLVDYNTALIGAACALLAYSLPTIAAM